jgi:hypothetical protein
MKNPRYVNSVRGISVDQDDGVPLYVDGGELYDSIVAGAFGLVAPYVDEPPPAPDPRATASLSRMDFMLALDAAGLLDDAEAVVTDPATPRQAKIMWANASEFRRTHPTLVEMATAMDLTEAQMDAVFGI